MESKRTGSSPDSCGLACCQPLVWVNPVETRSTATRRPKDFIALSCRSFGLTIAQIVSAKKARRCSGGLRFRARVLLLQPAPAGLLNERSHRVGVVKVVGVNDQLRAVQ